MSPLETLLAGVAALLGIAAAQALAPRVRLAAPLLLVLGGVAVGELPWVGRIELEPEWILAGVLPPLLYSSAVSMPAMDFRREFGAIGGLSVLLVLATTLVTGTFIAWVVPGLPLAWGIALGAVVSPTDAVATAIVKQLGVSDRVVTMLDGESLLNDATALVVLRSAIAAAAGAATVPGVLGDFGFAVIVAVAIGLAAGRANLWLRARTPDATVNTVLSFTVPFAASIPAEVLGASGLVAAVVAGLVTGRRAPRVLPPRHRLSDQENWNTVALVLEGGVFLLLGLQLAGILADVATGTGTALLAAAGVLVLTLAVRALYVGPLLRRIGRRTQRRDAFRPRLAAAQERLDADADDGAVVAAMRALGLRSPADQDDADADVDGARARRRARRIRRRHGHDGPVSQRQAQRFRTRVRRALADAEFLLANPLTERDGAIVIWAGMRGAVTLAAAQTLPEDAPSRSLLILIAFVVAVGSLALQGSTLPWVVRRLRRPADADPAADAQQRAELLDLLRAVADRTPEDPDPKAYRLAVLEAQRAALLDARDDGTFGSRPLTAVLAAVDADQISLELKGGPPGASPG